MSNRKAKRFGCLFLSLLLAMGTMTACGKSKKKKTVKEEEIPEFVIEVQELGVLGEDTDYPISMSLDSVGMLELKMTGGDDVNWVWEGTDALTVQTELLSGEEVVQEPDADSEAAISEEDGEDASEDEQIASEDGQGASEAEQGASEAEQGASEDGQIISEDTDGAVSVDEANENDESAMEETQEQIYRFRVAYGKLSQEVQENSSEELAGGVPAEENSDSESQNDSTENNTQASLDTENTDSQSQTQQEESTEELVDTEVSFSLIGREVGIRFNFTVEVKQNVITALLDSSVEEIEVSYEDISSYEEISDTLQEMRLPKGARIINYEDLDIIENTDGEDDDDDYEHDDDDEDDDEDDNEDEYNEEDDDNEDDYDSDSGESDTQEDEQQADEDFIACLIIGVGDESYRIAATSVGDDFGITQMKQMCESYLSSQEKDTLDYSKVETIGNTEVTMYHMGEVAIAVYELNEKNYFLFIDDESADFDAIESAARLFIEA